MRDGPKEALRLLSRNLVAACERLAGLAKVSGRLPLVFRYAVRDANRHRTRTVPAVSGFQAG